MALTIFIQQLLGILWHHSMYHSARMHLACLFNHAESAVLMKIKFGMRKCRIRGYTTYSAATTGSTYIKITGMSLFHRASIFLAISTSCIFFFTATFMNLRNVLDDRLRKLPLYLPVMLSRICDPLSSPGCFLLSFFMTHFVSGIISWFAFHSSYSID